MVFFTSHSAPADQLVVSATAGKRVRVRRAVLTTDTSGGFHLRGDPSGAGTPLLPRIEARATGPAIDLRFDREYPLTAVGVSLGYTTDITGNHGVWLEYELVD